MLVSRGHGRLRAIGVTLGVGLAAAGLFVKLWSSRVDAGRVYRVGYAQNPPFQSHGADGTPNGFAVEVVQRASDRAHLKLQWIYDPSATADSLRRGDVDLWPVLADLAERRSWAYVSDT